MPDVKELTGHCSNIGSYYICSVRNDCSIKSYHLDGTCHEKKSVNNNKKH